MKRRTRSSDDVIGNDKALPTSSLTLMQTSSITPEAIGVLCMALAPDGSQLVAARSNGSLALYQIVETKRGCSVDFRLNRGGQGNVPGRKIVWPAERGNWIIVGYLNGSIVVYPVDPPLTPIQP